MAFKPNDGGPSLSKYKDGLCVLSQKHFNII